MEFLTGRELQCMARNAAEACRVLCRVFVILPCLHGAPLSAQTPAPVSSEYSVKAAFLLNFARFVEWPSAAFSDPQDPMTICVLGDDPFGTVLDQTVAGEQVRNRPVATRRISSVARSRDCHVLFINSGSGNLPGIVDALDDGILTVSDQPGFVESGGIIEFAIESNRIRFDINERAASDAGLRLSSQLLRVARTIR
jgi:hypothetical protein